MFRSILEVRMGYTHGKYTRWLKERDVSFKSKAKRVDVETFYKVVESHCRINAK